jgi:eukaryotic-like serine/threonine-protein kinase
MRWTRPFLYVIAPFFFFGFSAYVTLTILLKIEQTVVCPDIRGKDVEEAKRFLQQRGISLKVIRYERRNDVPYNIITVQKPDANVPMRKSRVVAVLVSEGPELIRLPSVVGQAAEDAQGTLDALNIRVGKILAVPHRNAGMVLAQLPQGGEEVVASQKITLIVGTTGNGYFVMPELRGSYPSGVAADLDAKKIRYRMQFSRRDYGFPGQVAATTPPARTVFSADDEVVILVSPDG